MLKSESNESGPFDSESKTGNLEKATQVEEVITIKAETSSDSVDVEAVVKKKSVVESTVKRRILLTGIALCSSCAKFNGGAMGPVIGRIAHDFRDTKNTSWYVTAFLLSSSIFQLIAVKMSRCLGKRRTALGGVILLAISSLICELSTSSAMFIAIRVIQGCAAGVSMVMKYTSIDTLCRLDLFPKEKRRKYQPISFFSLNATRIIGPFLGGLFCDYGSWRWIFAFNTFYAIPVLVIFYFLLDIPIRDGQRLSSETPKKLFIRIDFFGCVLLVMSILGLLFGINLGSTLNRWSSPLVIGLFIGSCIMGVMLVLYEKFVSRIPLFPSSIIADRNMILLYILGFTNGVYSIQLIMFTAFRSINVYDATPTIAGIVIVPGVVCIVLGNVTQRMITQRIKCPKGCIIAGNLFVLLSTLLTMFVQTIYSGLGMEIGFVMLFGYGLGLYGQAIGMSALLVIWKKDTKLVPRSAGLTRFFILIGSTIGFSVLISLLRTFMRHELSTLHSTQSHLFDLMLEGKSLESFSEMNTIQDETVKHIFKQVYLDSLSKTSYAIVVCTVIAFFCSVFVRIPDTPKRIADDIPMTE
ncbi:MFS general substrate transporter [Backusella circina FSU 941]|nr:MFS general substrate transporter [Backusella circina FSU 941]